MVRNYKMTIMYDGTRYYGWQRLKGKDTIQGKIEDVLSRMCNEDITVNGAGRTDAGVHARGMVASAQMNTNLRENEIRDYMNQYLPEDIAVKEVRQASDRFHARYHAVGKHYCYTCFAGEVRPVFNRKYVTMLEKLPDILSMKKAALVLQGEHDFASFCGNPHMKKSTVRTVAKIEITQRNGYIYFDFHGNGFLQNMVRIMVGTLLEVGYGRMTEEDVKRILKAKDRKQSGPKAPAEGLCLVSVEY